MSGLSPEDLKSCGKCLLDRNAGAEAQAVLDLLCFDVMIMSGKLTAGCTSSEIGKLRSLSADLETLAKKKIEKFQITSIGCDQSKS